jgi:hypothetical protein
MDIDISTSWSKPWETTSNHLHIPKRFIQGLACRPIILPSHKISPWSSQASPTNPNENRLGKIAKQNDLWFQEAAAIRSPLGLYGGNRKTKLPLRPNTRIHAPEGPFVNFVVAPSDGCSAIVNLLSHDASLAISMGVIHFELSGLCCCTPVRPGPLTVRSVRCSCTSVFVLWSWFCGSTNEPNGFQVNYWKPCELGVPSSNHHSWLGSHEVSAWPWFWGSTKKLPMTSSCRSCHYATHTWLPLPPGPWNQAYLSSPHLEASSAMTFHACSSPKPTPVKSQPAPAIHS